MKKTFVFIVALSVACAVSARAGVQQTTPEQRREIEKRIGDLQQQMQELRRQLGDGPRQRTRVIGPQFMRVGPEGNRMMTWLGGRPKFGFTFETAEDSGARVLAVTPGSPAEKAGLKPGDLITTFNKVRLTGLDNPGDELRGQAEKLEVGDTVNVEFRRGSETRSLKMVAEDLSPNAFAYGFGDSGMSFEVAPRMNEMPRMFDMGMIPGRWMDMEMVSLNKDLGEYFGTSEGLLVVHAPKDSALALRAGDVILTIDGRKPTTPPQALRILRSYERGETFEIQVLRQKKRMTLKATVPSVDHRDGYFYPSDSRDD